MNQRTVTVCIQTDSCPATPQPWGRGPYQIKAKSGFPKTAPDKFLNVFHGPVGFHRSLQSRQIRLIASPKDCIAQTFCPIAHAKGTPVRAPVRDVQIQPMRISKSISKFHSVKYAGIRRLLLEQIQTILAAIDALQDQTALRLQLPRSWGYIIPRFLEGEIGP